MAKTAKLTEKQQRFVEEYLIDLNATQAAIRAGYSAKTADQQGSRMLANVKVQQAISGSMSRLWTQKVELFSPYLIARRDVF